ncbi:MAG: hypothetical protein PSV17_08570 [Methylotenera sp.]|uniref:hypothetical protein n=1 Tax=Methylotenera sp. TaxID=2051956 RepID=UPI0024877BBF|nr:hypothetical protein [Methylotenera sp.]MDI1309471.1 hypothetical protein [Methylotenera sp.]
MLKKPEKNENRKSISERLGINSNTDKATLEDLTNNDGNEDPGSELDTEFSKNKDSNNNTSNKKNDAATPQVKSGTLPKGEELDAFTNNASKKKSTEKDHPKPQADETINPNLNSENDI